MQKWLLPALCLAPSCQSIEQSPPAAPRTRLSEQETTFRSTRPEFTGTAQRGDPLRLFGQSRVLCAEREGAPVACSWGIIDVDLQKSDGTEHTLRVDSGVVELRRLNAEKITSEGWGFCVLADGEIECRRANRDALPNLSASAVIDVANAGDRPCLVNAEHDVYCVDEAFCGEWPAAVRMQRVPVAAAYRVTAAPGYACALHAAGFVSCWGRTSNAECSLDPSLIPGIKGAVSVHAARRSACALLSDNTVKCWGSNRDGALGIPTSQLESSNEPVLVSGLGTIVELVSGASSFVALSDEGKVWYWGKLVPKEKHGTVVEAELPRPAVGVHSGSVVGCALLNDHSIRCFGRDVEERDALGIKDGGRYRFEDPEIWRSPPTYIWKNGASSG